MGSPASRQSGLKASKPGGRRSDRALNRDVVIAAALEEIDAGGLDAFSVRNLAKRLGVYPTAISWHTASKSQLLADVVSLTLADILPTGFPDSWQNYLRQFFHLFREAIRRHPNVAPLIGAQLVANPALELDFIERLLSTLAHAGFTGVQLVAAYNAVIAAVVGFTTQEFAPTPSGDTKVWQKGIRDRLQEVPAGKFPKLSQNMKLLGNKAFTLRWQNGTEAPMDVSFQFFVDTVILGLERQASAHQ